MTDRSQPWSESETELALRLRSEGNDPPAIALAVGRSVQAVAARFRFLALSPEERAARGVKYRQAAKVKRQAQGGPPVSGICVVVADRPTAAQIAERDYRFSQPRTFSQIYLGDPLPGQSALDKRNMEACRG